MLFLKTTHSVWQGYAVSEDYMLSWATEDYTLTWEGHAGIAEDYTPNPNQYWPKSRKPVAE